MSVPAIILVNTQLGENIGTTARAMANFGLTDLRLVGPREGWPNERAKATASGAPVIEHARVFATAAEAVADLNLVYATTARVREIAKPVVGPREAATAARQRIGGGGAVGVLFGPERSGLTNEDVALADAILTLPVHPDFTSLNVAQAVLVFAYEWRLSGMGEVPELPFGSGLAGPASKEELIRMFEQFEEALDRVEFFRPPEKRPHMVLALRSMLQRAGLTEQEVRTFRGVIAALDRRPTRPRRKSAEKPGGEEG